MRLRTPRYVHFDLFAEANLLFLGTTGAGRGTAPQSKRLCGEPGSLYPATARRGCRPPRPPRQLELGTQTEFPEPPARINTDVLDADLMGWSGAQVSEDFVAYYASSS